MAASAMVMKGLDMDVPPELKKFSSAARMLLLGEARVAKIQLFNIRKAVMAGTFTVMGELVTVPEFIAFLEFLRPRLEFPVAPLDLPWSTKECIIELPKTVAPRLAWQWWDMPIPWIDDSGSEYNLFPMPIANVRAGFRVQGYTCLISATALWHLLPCKEAASRFFATDERTKPRWELWTEMGIAKQEVLAPPRSDAAKERSSLPSQGGGPWGRW